jgi:pimeloyl-ACP methyl ester carboxylesterase
MNDPKRWLDEGGGATFEERQLLDAGRRAVLPSAFRRRLWLGVATSAIGIGAASEAAGAMTSVSSAKGVLAALLGSAAAKGVAALALVGGAGVGVAALRSPPSTVAATAMTQAVRSRAVPPAPAPPATPSDESVPTPIRAAPVRVRTASAKPVVAAVRGDARSAPAGRSSEEEVRPREAPVESRMATRLREESATILSVRKTLLAGDAVEALRMLDRARTAFPNGSLAEEREALAVRALVASGQNDLARKRGEVFLRVFPRSPHASEVRAVLGP